LSQGGFFVETIQKLLNQIARQSPGYFHGLDLSTVHGLKHAHGLEFVA
jgi:hypothetical protein